MKFRVREEDTHFYLNPRKDGEIELLLNGGLRLWSYVRMPKEMLSSFKVMLQDRKTGSIHHKHRVFRHSIVVSRQPYFCVELSRNIELFGALIVDENYSVTLYEPDLDSFVNWLGECGL
jgi:hypothetical protein